MSAYHQILIESGISNFSSRLSWPKLTKQQQKDSRDRILHSVGVSRTWSYLSRNNILHHWAPLDKLTLVSSKFRLPSWIISRNHSRKLCYSRGCVSHVHTVRKTLVELISGELTHSLCIFILGKHFAIASPVVSLRENYSSRKVYLVIITLRNVNLHFCS